MSRVLVGALVVLGGVAHAQPGQTPPGPVAPAPPAPYLPPPYLPPYGYGVPLTSVEIQLLDIGEISDAQHLGGGLVAVFFGLGIGQAMQGRWSDTGWIFTVGELGSIAAIAIGLSIADSCVDGCGGGSDAEPATLIIGGALGYSVFRVWGAIDAFVEPPRHNRRIRELRLRMGYPPPRYPYYGAAPFVVPAQGGDGAIAGLSLRF